MNGGAIHWDLRTPNGIRTRVTAVKGQRPRPLDDGGISPNVNWADLNYTVNRGNDAKPIWVVFSRDSAGVDPAVRC